MTNKQTRKKTLKLNEMKKKNQAYLIFWQLSQHANQNSDLLQALLAEPLIAPGSQATRL